MTLARPILLPSAPLGQSLKLRLSTDLGGISFTPTTWQWLEFLGILQWTSNLSPSWAHHTCTTTPPSQWHWGGGHVLEHPSSQALTSDKAFVVVVGITMGGYTTLVVV